LQEGLDIFGLEALENDVKLSGLRKRLVELGVPANEVNTIFIELLGTTRQMTSTNLTLDASNENVAESYRQVRAAVDAAKGA
jgi:hypothetical protein